MTEQEEQSWSHCLALYEEIRATLQRFQEQFGPEIEEWRRTHGRFRAGDDVSRGEDAPGSVPER